MQSRIRPTIRSIIPALADPLQIQRGLTHTKSNHWTPQSDMVPILIKPSTLNTQTGICQYEHHT